MPATITIFVLISTLTGMPIYTGSSDHMGQFATYSDCENFIAEAASANQNARREMTCKAMTILK